MSWSRVEIYWLLRPEQLGGWRSWQKFADSISSSLYPQSQHLALKPATAHSPSWRLQRTKRKTSLFINTEIWPKLRKASQTLRFFSFSFSWVRFCMFVCLIYSSHKPNWRVCDEKKIVGWSTLLLIAAVNWSLSLQVFRKIMKSKLAIIDKRSIKNLCQDVATTRATDHD